MLTNEHLLTNLNREVSAIGNIFLSLPFKLFLLLPISSLYLSLYPSPLCFPLSFWIWVRNGRPYGSRRCISSSSFSYPVFSAIIHRQSEGYYMLFVQMEQMDCTSWSTHNQRWMSFLFSTTFSVCRSSFIISEQIWKRILRGNNDAHNPLFILSWKRLI